MSLVRRPDLDAAKGWGMLLVVLGHAAPPEWATTLIYGFHMPLFFVISGILWNGSVRPGGVLRRLMVPFYWGSVATWFVWVAKVLFMKPDGVPLWGPLLATVYGGNLFGYLVHNGALWFLPALFALYVTLWLLMYATSSRAALVGSMTTLGVVMLLVSPDVPALRTLPLSLGQGLVGGLFFVVGWLGRSTLRERSIVRPLSPWHVIAFALGSAVLILTERFNGRVDLLSMQFGQPALYLLDGLLGSTLMVGLCRLPCMQWSLIRMIGANTLQVLVFHQPLMWVLRFVFSTMNVESNCLLLTGLTLSLFLLVFNLLEWHVRYLVARTSLNIKS